MRRRSLLAGLAPAALAWRSGPAIAAQAAEPVAAARALAGVTRRPLAFPADHGAHPDTHVEWWYITGWLRSGTQLDAARPPEFGFQVTFFRSRTDLAETSASRFAARQLVFAHVALTDLAAGAKSGATGLLHDQRVAREGFGLAQTPAPSGTQVVRLGDWSLSRAAAAGAGAGSGSGSGSGYDSGSGSGSGASASAATALHVDLRAERFALDLALQGTQPLLLQGDAGYSRKGPREHQASHYYSEPQLAVSGRVERAGAPARAVVGRAWLDHEWSNEYLPPEAVGWDWVGFNLIDGAALMAFRLRRADGSALWAGGSFRSAAGELRVFAAGEVAFRPLRRWHSPRTQFDYPVEWQLDTPAGRFHVAALQDDQELDSRGSTGSLYWEGVSALRDEAGAVVGWGYLELTGYTGRLRL